MRSIPFEDETFDYVYEHYSMCHLSKQDTTLAVSEMLRVLKRGGLCFLGFISADSWPKSLFGQEREPGEYWGDEGGNELTLHSLFTDQEADQLVLACEIVSKYKQVRYLREAVDEILFAARMEFYEETGNAFTRDNWQSRYESRANLVQYSHLWARKEIV
jgi:ubiquinone/menaquinone biosynthesis C-methylase UbiE